MDWSRFNLFGGKWETGFATRAGFGEAGWTNKESSETGRQMKRMLQPGVVVCALSPSTLHAEAGILGQFVESFVYIANFRKSIAM